VTKAFLSRRNEEAKIHVSPKQVVGVVERGEDLRLLDVRSAEEWQAGRIRKRGLNASREI